MGSERVASFNGLLLTMTDSVSQRTIGPSSIEVTPADTPALIRRFVEVPFEFYANDPHWVPPLRRDELRRFSTKHNAFLQHADITAWLAMDGTRVRGRIAAIEDRLYEQVHGERIGWFGFFEADSAATTAALLDAVERWARARRLPVVRGPVNPSLNESGGLLVEGFDSDPYALMPYNPPHYARYIESAGYAKAKDLFAWTIDVPTPLPERITRIAARVQRQRHVTLRAANLKQFDAELQRMQSIYKVAWQANWGFVPPTDAEIRQLAVELKPVLDPELLQFAEIDGRPVGCSVAIPDVNQVLKKMGGNLLPFGLFHFLNRKRIVTRLRLLILGVLPEYRNSGLYPLLIAEAQRRANLRGYKTAELSWTLEDNEAVNAGIAAAGGRHYKTYRIYEKPVG